MTGGLLQARDPLAEFGVLPHLDQGVEDAEGGPRA
jgi:hypothetical protein